MKKHLLMKTLLVALVCLVGGTSSVWATDVPYNVGTSTSDTWGTAFSDVWTMTGDGAVTVTFTNHCATTGNWWENWQLLCGNSNYTPAAHADGDRYFQMRSDRWDDAANSGVGFIASDDYFTDFKTFQNEATVNLMIVRSGTTVTVNVAVTKSATTRTMTFVKTGLSGTLNFFLTQSLSYMTITQQNQTTEMAGTVTCNALMNFDNFTGDNGADTPGNIAGGKGTMTFGGAKLVKIAEGDYRVGMRSGSSNISIASTEYAGVKDIVTISFDLNYCQMGANKKVYFNLKDAFNNDIASLDVGTQKDSPYFRVFNSNTLGITSDDIIINHNTTSSWGNKVHFTITLNYLTGKITTTTACAGATNTTSSHTVDMTNTNSFAKFVIGADYNSDYPQYRSQYDNLLIQTEKGDYNTTANITLSFKDNEDNDISALYTGTSDFTPEKGSTFKPSDYYPAVMYDENYKYTYTSGGDDFVVSTNAVVTLVYTKSARPTYTYNVTANYGAKNKKIVDGVSVKEAANYTYYYPRFILDGTTLYEYASSTDANASASYWTSTNTNVAANANYTLTYNAIEGECVYYSEGEDIASKTGDYTYDNWRAYMSNGKSGVFDSGALTSLEAGNYAITVRAIGRATDRYIDIYKDSKADENKLLRVTSQNNGAEASCEFTLTGNTDIIIDGGATNNSENGHGCDYVYIMKLPDNVSVTVTDADFATYVPSYDLNFSATGIEAYKVKVTAKGVATLTKVNNVPAGTPVLLYKDGGKTEDIPVMTGAAAVSDNDLVAGTGAAVATTVGEYTNMILNNIGGNVGFYFANGQTVAANRAYLHFATTLAPDPAAARMTMIFEDDDVTGVNEVRSQKEDVRSEWFDLQGRKVAQPQKGLYIVNGKKVMVK